MVSGQPRLVVQKEEGLKIGRRRPADLLEAAQMENRVADQLSRAMEGDEAASAAAVDVSAQQAKPIQHLLGVGLVADPSSVDRRVFTQQQGVSRTGPVPVHI